MENLFAELETRINAKLDALEKRLEAKFADAKTRIQIQAKIDALNLVETVLEAGTNNIVASVAALEQELDKVAPAP